MSNMVPSESGYYWMKTEYPDIHKPSIEIVLVCMNYPYRSKFIPYIIGGGWRGRLDEFIDSRNNITFSPKITPPEGFEHDIR